MKNIVFTLTFIYLICQICSNSNSKLFTHSNDRVEYITNNNFTEGNISFGKSEMAIEKEIPGWHSSSNRFVLTTENYDDHFGKKKESNMNFLNFFGQSVTITQHFEALEESRSVY